MNSFRVTTLLLFLSMLSGITSAQSKNASSPASTSAKSDFAQESVIIERYVTKLTFESDGTSTRDVVAAARVQADAGVKELAILTLPYTSSSETVDVDYVRVRKPDGNVVITPDYNIQDMPADVTRAAPMYSDLHAKHITVKALGVGDTLEYHIVFKTVKPEVPGQFWYEHNLIKDAIVKDEQLEISVPKEKLVNVSSNDVQPQIRTDGDRKIYVWKSSNLERKPKNEKEYPKREAPRPMIEVSTFQSWAQVGRWYAELQAPQANVTPEIQAKAISLTKDLATDEDKIRAIYGFVASKFHYVSLSFGIGRYQPHAADDVFSNEYGDCKDKHTLFATMLKAIGIDALPVLINSGRKIDDDIPSPAAFDHLITAIPRGEKVIWLDTTTEVAPFGMLSATLRGKKALLVPPAVEATLITTPESLPFASSETFEVAGKLDSEGTFNGEVKQTLRGDSELLYRLGFRQVAQAQWQELAQRFSYIMGFAGDVSDVHVSTPEDTGNPFQVSYSYVRKKYGDWDNHRITPPMPPFGIEVSDTDERKPVEPFYLGAPGEVVFRAKVELPSFARPKTPKNLDLVEDFAEYHSHYTLENGVLTAERKIIVKQKEVPLAAWDRYTAFRKKVSDDKNQWIDLDPASTTASNTGANAELDRTFDDALDAFRNQDYSKAEALMQKVIKADPKYPHAHANLGQLYAIRNRFEDALVELHKEEEISPKFAPAYNMAARIQKWLKRDNEALDEWRKLLKADPANIDAALNLGQVLEFLKKYPEAIEVYDTALKSSPENEALVLRLGSAYIEAGHKEKGVALIIQVADKSLNANNLNTAAWQLAEAETELEAARAYSEKSLKYIDEKAASDRTSSHANEYGMYWDTLGWVYFKMGNLAKAEDYLHAAWMLLQGADIGDHLAQVYQKEGKVKQAEHVYRLAYAVPTGAEKKDIQEHYRKLTGRAIGVNVGTHRLPDGTWSLTPAEELSRMRTVKLSTPSHSTANATFNLVLTPGKIESVEFVDGSEDLKVFGEKLKTAKIPVHFPADVQSSRLLRQGIVSCSQLGCDFVLMPTQSAFIQQRASGF